MISHNAMAARGSATALLLLTLSGCASDGNSGIGAALRPVTPSFMLTEHDRAERNLKDPKTLNLAYGKFQEQIGQPTEARKSYELALHDDPRSVDAILGLARLDQLAEKPKDAEAGFQKALRLKPGDPAVLAACGQFYASQKRWPEAFKSFNAAIAEAPTAVTYKHQLAVARTRSGDVNGGLAMFTELIGPEKAHYNVAFLLRQEGRNDAALQQCRMALSLNPNFEAAKSLIDQIESKDIARNQKTPDRTMAGPATVASTARNSFDVAYPEAGSGSGRSSPAAPSRTVATQTSWQSPLRETANQPSLGSGDASRSFPAIPSAAPTGQQLPASVPRDSWPATSGEPAAPGF